MQRVQSHFRARFHLLSKRVPRRAARFVGMCTKCGVQFMSVPDKGPQAEQVLAVHRLICPGGDRAGDVAMPFEDTES